MTLERFSLQLRIVSYDAATLFAAPAFAQTSVTTTTSPNVTGSIEITTQQEALLGQVISRHPTRRAAQQVTVGATLPTEVELQTLSQEFVTEAPTVRTSRYVTTGAGVALVDPNTRRVVRIIQMR